MCLLQLTVQNLLKLKMLESWEPVGQPDKTETENAIGYRTGYRTKWPTSHTALQYGKKGLDVRQVRLISNIVSKTNIIWGSFSVGQRPPALYHTPYCTRYNTIVVNPENKHSVQSCLEEHKMLWRSTNSTYEIYVRDLRDPLLLVIMPGLFFHTLL